MSTEGQMELIHKLAGYVRDATEALRAVHDQWEEYEGYYQGIQDEKFALDQEQQRKNWSPVNFVFAHTETVVGMVGDSAPELYVRAVGGAPEEAAEQLTLALQGVWYQGHGKGEYKQAVRNQQLLGTGFLKCWWNGDAGDQVTRLELTGFTEKVVTKRQGEVQVEWLDPYAVYPDPTAKRIEDCEYIAFAHDVSAEKAHRLWDRPGPGGVKFDESTATQVESDTERPESWWGRMFGWVQKTFVQRPPGGRLQYRVWEVYHEGGKRLTIYTGQQVLWDGDNPCPGGHFPVVAFRAHPRGHSIFGMPVTSQIIELQDQYNKAKMNINAYMHICAKPTWWSDDPKTTTTFAEGITPGKVFAMSPERQLHAVEYPPMPPFSFQMLALMREEIDTVTGVHDVTRGVKPGSVQSGIGIQQLQEAGQTRLRSMVSDNTEDLETLGKLILGYIQKYYVSEGEGRSFAYRGPSGFVQGEVRPEMIEQEVSLDGLVEGGGSYREPWQYRVVVEGGQEIPMNAMAQFEIATRLAGQPAEDGLPMVRRQDVLEAAKLPKRAEIVAWFEQMRQGQAAAQDQQQQAMMQQAVQELAAAVASGQELTPEQQQLMMQLPPELQQEIMGLAQQQAQGGGQVPAQMGVV